MDNVQCLSYSLRTAVALRGFLVAARLSCITASGQFHYCFIPADTMLYLILKPEQLITNHLTTHRRTIHKEHVGRVCNKHLDHSL